MVFEIFLVCGLHTLFDRAWSRGVRWTCWMWMGRGIRSFLRYMPRNDMIDCYTRSIAMALESTFLPLLIAAEKFLRTLPASRLLLFKESLGVIWESTLVFHDLDNALLKSHSTSFANIVVRPKGWSAILSQRAFQSSHTTLTSRFLEECRPHLVLNASLQ